VACCPESSRSRKAFSSANCSAWSLASLRTPGSSEPSVALLAWSVPFQKTRSTSGGTHVVQASLATAAAVVPRLSDTATVTGTRLPATPAFQLEVSNVMGGSATPQSEARHAKTIGTKLGRKIRRKSRLGSRATHFTLCSPSTSN